MKKSEFFALSQFLTDWPDGLSFSEVLEAVEDEDSSITRWHLVQYWPAYELSDAIDSMEKAFSRTVADILNEEKHPQPSDALNAQMGDPVKFLKDHFTIVNIK